MLVHGTAIAINGLAVLLTGPSLSGKSDLALRAMQVGAALIADDLVAIRLSGKGLIAARPDGANPVIAIRGIGLVRPTDTLHAAPLALSVRLDPLRDRTSLLPRLGQAGPWHGQHAPEIALNPFEASAVTKLALALERFGI